MTWGEVQRQALKKLDLPDQAFREEYRPALVQAANEGALLLATAGPSTGLLWWRARGSRWT